MPLIGFRLIVQNLLLASVLFLVACELKTVRPAYRAAGVSGQTLHFSSNLIGKASGSSGGSDYSSHATAVLTVKCVSDSAKGQVELAFNVDSLSFHSAERAPEEDAYMVGRLLKYHAKLVLTRTGQLISLEEEPVLPPVEFSPLNFARLLVYGLPAFPGRDLKPGDRWESHQSLLDKFHPESEIKRNFLLTALRDTPLGKVAVVEMSIETALDGDLGSLRPAPVTLQGKGEIEFNLDKGLPISANLQVEGTFAGKAQDSGGDSATVEPVNLHLQESLNLRFLN